MNISQGDERLSGPDNCLTQPTTTHKKKTKHIEKIINHDMDISQGDKPLMSRQLLTQPTTTQNKTKHIKTLKLIKTKKSWTSAKVTSVSQG